MVKVSPGSKVRRWFKGGEGEEKKGDEDEKGTYGDGGLSSREKVR